MEAALLFEDDQTFWKLKAIQYQSFRQHQKWRRLTRVLLRQSLKDFECLTFQYLKIQSDGKILERTSKKHWQFFAREAMLDFLPLQSSWL